MQTYLDFSEMTADELETAQSDILDTYYGAGMDISNLTQANYSTMRIYDPISYISNDTVPTLIIHGVIDDVIKDSQSDLLEVELNEFDIDYEYHSILGGNNGLTTLLENEVENICDYVADFIAAQYIEI